jgi:hypothetical protein
LKTASETGLFVKQLSSKVEAILQNIWRKSFFLVKLGEATFLKTIVWIIVRFKQGGHFELASVAPTTCCNFYLTGPTHTYIFILIQIFNFDQTYS